MLPPDNSRKFAVLVGGRVIRFAPNDASPLQSGESYLPVVEGVQPTPAPDEWVMGPNYRIDADAVTTIYWLEKK